MNKPVNSGYTVTSRVFCNFGESINNTSLAANWRISSYYDDSMKTRYEFDEVLAQKVVLYSHTTTKARIYPGLHSPVRLVPAPTRAVVL